MLDRTTRRHVLLTLGGAVGAGIAGTSTAGASDARSAAARGTATAGGSAAAGEASECDELLAEGREPGDTSFEEEMARLQAEIMAAHADSLPSSAFSASERDRALRTGRSTREGVVVFDGKSEAGGIQGHGTGWLVDGGYVVTNAHNVDHAVAGRTTDILCHLPDGAVLDVEVVDYVRERPPVPDVAVLATDFDGPGLRLGSTDSLTEGQPLVQVGHPGGFGFWTITFGAFLERSGGELTATVPSLEGASGSPVTTLDGEVVGMLSGIRGAADGGDPTPTVTDVPVQQGLLAAESVSEYVPVETIVEKLEAWT